MSREHIITEGLWRGREIQVQGFAWCRTKYVSISPANLTANILCRQHNSALSAIDDEGIRAFDIFRSANELQEARKRYLGAGFAPIPFPVEQYEIDGYKFESWLLKTAINTELAGDQGVPIGPTASDVSPTPKLVRIAYGIDRFHPNAGLYFIGRINRPLNVGERLSYEAWICKAEDEHEYVSAVRFNFYGCGFVLNLNQSIEFPQEMKTWEGVVNLLYRPYGFNIELNRRPSQKIKLQWGQARVE